MNQTITTSQQEAQRLFDEGYQQTSRRYRMLARVPKGSTAMEVLYNARMQEYRKLPNENKWSVDVRRWVNLLGEAQCRDHYCRVYAKSITVSAEVFEAFLKLNRR